MSQKAPPGLLSYYHLNSFYQFVIQQLRGPNVTQFWPSTPIKWTHNGLSTDPPPLLFMELLNDPYILITNFFHLENKLWTLKEQIRMFSLMPCPFTGPKNFGLDQILCARPIFFFYILWQSQTFCARENWFLCRHKSFWRGTKCSLIFGLAQKIWTSTKHFGTCKRTRHKSSLCLA